MKRYTFNVDATSVHGSQTYFVDAESEDEAREVVESGGGEFVCEELEVQDLEAFTLVEVEDVPTAPQAAHATPTAEVSNAADCGRDSVNGEGSMPKIGGTDQAWDAGLLGRDERYVEVVGSLTYADAQHIVSRAKLRKENAYIRPYPSEGKVVIEGKFTPEELEAIAFMLKAKIDAAIESQRSGEGS